MKKSIKVASLALTFALMIPMSSFTASAASFGGGSISRSSSGHNFEKSWEAKYTCTDPNGNGTLYMKYGFNTYLVDEDYVKGYHPKQVVSVSLKQGDTSKSKTSKAGQQVVLERAHNNKIKTVYYYMNW